MKRSQKLFIGILALMIVGCWAILAFFIREDLVERFSLWSSMIVGTATVIIAFVSLYISLVTYKKDVDSNKTNSFIDNKKEKI